MNLHIIFISIFIGSIFVGWPTVAKYLGFHGAWANIVVSLGTGITAILLSWHYIATQNIKTPDLKGVIILLVVSAVNGYAVTLYAREATNPNLPTAIFIVLVSVFMVVWAPILDYVLNGNAPNFKHLIGYLCSIGAIYFLSIK